VCFTRLLADIAESNTTVAIWLGVETTHESVCELVPSHLFVLYPVEQSRQGKHVYAVSVIDFVVRGRRGEGIKRA
jgi:hypothetical protein